MPVLCIFQKMSRTLEKRNLPSRDERNRKWRHNVFRRSGEVFTCGFRHLPRPSPRWSMPRAPWFFSCGRATAPPVIRSPVHLPRDLRPAPQAQYFSFPLAHVLPRILVLTPQRIRRTPSGPAVHLSSLSTARQGVSGPRVVQPFIFTSLSAARKAFPDPEWSRRSSSLAIRRQEGVSGPRVVQPFIFTRYPPPGRRFRTATGPGVHLRSSIRLQEGVYGPEGPTVLLNSSSRRSDDAFGSRMVQSFSSARLSATR